MIRRPHEAHQSEPNEAYLRLLKGEISSQDFVKVIERSVGLDKRAAVRSARRAIATES